MIIIDDPNHSMIPIVLRELMKRKPMLPLKWIKIFYEDYTQTGGGGKNKEDDIILYNCFISKKRNSSSYVVSFGVEDTTNEGNKIIEVVNDIKGFMYDDRPADVEDDNWSYNETPPPGAADGKGKTKKSTKTKRKNTKRSKVVFLCVKK